MRRRKEFRSLADITFGDRFEFDNQTILHNKFQPIATVQPHLLIAYKAMMKDEVVEQVRKAREELASKSSL